MATDLMNAHPDLTGLVGECTSSAPGRGAGGAGREQDRQGLHRRPRHPAVDEAVPGQGLVDRGDPVERREPRLPDRVDRRPARRGQAVRRHQRRQRRDLSAIKYDAASKTLLLGPPLAITKDNVDKFNY